MNGEAMSTLLFSETWETGHIHCRRTRLGDRLLRRLGSRRLDLALAYGASPDGSAALSQHAHSLIGMRTRGTLARSLSRAMANARSRVGPYHSAVPVCRPGILRCWGLLEDLRGRLLEPGPVDARGMALVRLLLTDGASPLYGALDDGALDRWLRVAIDALAVEDI
jgi:hypothetical protein